MMVNASSQCEAPRTMLFRFLLLFLALAPGGLVAADQNGAYNIALPGWAAAWGKVRLAGNSWVATRLVRVLNAAAVNISGVSPADRPKTSVAQILSVPGASLYRAIATQRGCQYDVSFRMQSPLLQGDQPAPLLVSAVELPGFRSLGSDILAERMVRGFTPQRFSFVASGPATLLTFAAVPVAGAAAVSTGPGIAELQAQQRSCSGGGRLLRADHSSSADASPLPPLDSAAVLRAVQGRVLAGLQLPVPRHPLNHPVVNRIRARSRAVSAPTVTPTPTPVPSPPAGPPGPPPPSPPPPPQAFYGMFTAGKPAQPLAPVFYAGNVQLAQNNALVKHAVAGGRWQSSRQYASGVFSATIECPPANQFKGLELDFVMDTSNMGLNQRQRIGFQFRGASPQAVTAVANVLGQQNSVSIPLNFSCSDAPHLYSLYWDAQRVEWYVDQVSLYRVFPSNGAVTPIQPLFLYGGLNKDVGSGQASLSVAQGAWRGISVLSPLMYSVAPQVPLAMPPTDYPHTLPLAILSAFKVDYSLDHCEGCLNSTDGSAVIRMDNKADGSRFRSPLPLAFALVSADMKCPEGDATGAVAAFYTSSWEGAQSRDEIDFEWTLKNKTRVQTNFFVGGIGGNEVMVDLGFDCSTDFHNYAILWTPSHLIWYVDYKPVRVLLNQTGTVYPSQQQYVYSSFWDASYICDGCWAGKRSNATKEDPNWSLRLQYKNVKISGPLITGGY